jgi:hypothetical protein
MSLARQAALDDLAQHLYNFLPGNPHPYANRSISFAEVANELGLGKYWPGGSKQPAIRHLLGAVFQTNSDLAALILKIVERSITYRKKSNPLTREEIDRLNEILLRVGFKIPELHEPAFLSTLPRTTSRPGNQASATSVDPQTITTLFARLLKLSAVDPQRRGYEFEVFLSDLFHAYGLAPRGAFRLTGEQIDGSFTLRSETYLLEGKRQNTPVGLSELLTFQGKVEGKALWSRGLFISYSGFSKDGMRAFASGRRTSTICMDGLDLSEILAGNFDLVQVILAKARRAAETNTAFVPVRELMTDKGQLFVN